MSKEIKRVFPYINGNYVKSRGENCIEYVLKNAMNATPVTAFYDTSRKQVHEAIESSKNVQAKWANDFSPQERSLLLLKTAEILKKKGQQIAQLETLDTGRVIQETSFVDVDGAVDCLRYYAGIAPAIGGQTIQHPRGNWSYTLREALGVTAGIGAWNYPLQSAIWKSAPALAFGNTMIFKPSEETPLTALLLAESYVEAGIPPGVFNVVLGAGSVGEILSSDARIAKVSFTGSFDTGRKVYQTAAYDLKRVTMELGGKSPLIIFDDADIENAVSGVMLANWYSNGQVCSNGTRVFIHEKIKDKFLERFIERTKLLKIGNPMDSSVHIGPMIHQKHRDKVYEYIQLGKKEGAKLVYGGEKLTMKENELKDGYYLSPAIFDTCEDTMRIVQEEIFGMVCCLLTFSDEEQVIQRANDTPYGLSAGVFTKDIQRAHRCISKLQAGTTWINNYNIAPTETPWGGYKHSGVGRENGFAGADAWTQLKSVYVEMNSIDCPYP